MLRVALLTLLAFPAIAVAQPGTHQVKLNGHTFTLPQGFTIELAAGAEMAPRPIACDFDDKGRLYVTDSSGSNANVKEQLEKKPHRIVRLESTKGDGKFDKQTVFVKNIMFPEGCMWLNGSLYVAAPPHILKFTDTNDDGVADKEEIWFDGKTLTGCANDLHGPYRGPDGWIYWTKGAFAKQEYTVNGKPFKTRAAHIFRARPDGTGLEPVMTGGMDNPVDVVFTPGGDMIFTTTFFQHPANGRRDGLVHAIHGAVYGKDHDPVYEHPWTSPTLMPPMTHMGPAAPSGLHRYESDQFGKEYANNLFACQFNMRKVSRHILVPKGSTYETKDSDFVVSDNLDFHPTDVIEDADGSLLIVDTGGWYKLCCPTSQLVKPDVTGAIYRVKRDGAHKVDDPRGLKIEWKQLKPEELVKLMSDKRPAVAQQAADRFARAADADVNMATVLMAANLPQTNRLTILRAMSRGGHAETVRRYMRDHDPVVLSAAVHLLGLVRDKQAASVLLMTLTDKDHHVRRAAAEALGRIRDPNSIAFLLSTLDGETNDRALDHALTYALIEIGDVKKVVQGLGYHSTRVRRAALAALSNIPGANLEAKPVLDELNSHDEALRETAWWIAGRHPQWGDQLAGHFTWRLGKAQDLPQAERDELASRMRKFVGTPAVQAALADAVLDAKTATFACSVMARSGLKAMPKEWAAALVQAIEKNSNHSHDVLGVFRALPATEAEYLKLLKATADVFVKIDLISGGAWLHLHAAAPPGIFELNSTGFDLARGVIEKHHSPEVIPGIRTLAIDVLARHKLSTKQFVELATVLNATGPLELTKLLNVFEKSKDEKVGLALVAALRAKEVRPSIRAEMVKPILDKYPKAVQAEAEKLYAELAEARKDERAKLDRMIADLKPGDIRRGQIVFNGARTQCIACHKVGYVGGTLGPDLTKIGSIRTERDLLEAIVFPSASFVRSYEPVRVVTTDERTFNGILKKDAPDEIVIAVAADKEERIARADVASISPSAVSIMPSGLDQQLTPQDLADLVAFLRACK